MRNIANSAIDLNVRLDSSSRGVAVVRLVVDKSEVPASFMIALPGVTQTRVARSLSRKAFDCIV